MFEQTLYDPNYNQYRNRHSSKSNYNESIENICCILISCMYQNITVVMSFVEKNDLHSPDEWKERVQTCQVTRADMNRLIMNYLVTGTFL